MTGRELEYIKDALHRGHLSGDGFYTGQCSQWLEKNLKTPRALLTSSCTQALELAYLLIGVKPGQQVVLPSFTFPSTANAFVLWGAKPRFVDIREDTLNLDENMIEEAINSSTVAISPVHYGGVSCEMKKILKIARKKHLYIVADSAQALGGSYHGRPTPSYGDLEAISFHETKNVNCGEGGALIINDPQFIKRAEILRQKGTNRAQFYRGEVDKYSWVDIGSSYVPSELQAAYLYAQLQSSKKIGEKRKSLFNFYYKSLVSLQDKGHLRLPVIPSHIRSSYHLFYVLLENQKTRDRLIDHLRNHGIKSVFHYFPLHLSAMGKKFGYAKGDFPVTEKIADRLLRFPLFNSMSHGEQFRVVSAVKSAFR